MPNETKFEKLVNDVIQQTRSRKLAWKATDRAAFAGDVLHGMHIFRSYMADQYQRGDDLYRLGFIDTKAIDEDYGVESAHPELLVYSGERLILTVTEYHVDLDLLVRLRNLISDQNEEAQSLLATF